MSTLRDTNQIKSWAHRVLDEVRAGMYHDMQTINQALMILGEPVND